MKWLYYSILALFSLGMLGLIAGVAIVVVVISTYSRDLPDYSALKDYNPPVTTRIYAGDGRLMEEYAAEKRIFVPIDSMPDLVKNAFIAAEDQNFYTHQGVDPIAIARAVVTNFKSGGRPQGASTITQQVAKNFLLTNEVSYERKIREAILAFRMEKAMSKDRLLELYLNEIFLGQRSYGVAAAALNYFNKSLSELSIEEAAYLAALPKGPNNYSPARHYDAAIARRNWVIDRMVVNGYADEAQADIAKAKPLTVVDRGAGDIVRAPYFAEEVRRELEARYGKDALYEGGLAVRTSVNPTLQAIAEKSLRDGLMAFDRRRGWRGPVLHLDSIDNWVDRLAVVPRPEGMLRHWDMAIVTEASTDAVKIGLASGTRGALSADDVKWTSSKPLIVGDVIMVETVTTKAEDKAGDGKEKKTIHVRQVPKVNGALIAMDPHTGRVLAMQGGWHFDNSSFNRATQAQRQPGSAFKPFIYLAALDSGFTPSTLVLDAPLVIDQGPGLPKWRPTNYSNEYYGPTPIRVGVEKSRNLMTVRLADYIGMDKVATYAEKFGIFDKMKTNLANSLGAQETTVLDMTAAYAMLVNGGKKITPTFIDRIQDRRGKTIYSDDARQCDGCGPLIEWASQDAPVVPDTREQINDPRTAYQMVSILEGVVQRGTAAKIRSLGVPLAGKTGTTNDSKDAWFVGFSPDLAVGVFMGYDEPKSLGAKETGASAAVPVFKDFMEDALKDQPATPFRIPPGIRQVQINAESGARARPGDKKTIWEAFLAGTEPTDKIYILDGNGISVMSSFQRDLPYAGTAADQPWQSDSDLLSPYTQPMPDGSVPGVVVDEQQLYPSQPYGPQPETSGGSRPQSVTTGTGGLY